MSQLLPRLRSHLEDRGIANVDIVLTYDGTADERGVTVRFDTPPADIGGAWISLDANLEEQDLETTGVYRQTLTPQGGAILQAPLRDRPRST